MHTAILFKILQRRYRFRNPHHWTKLPELTDYTVDEYESAQQYIQHLIKTGISYSHPECPLYPRGFLKMKEPPLFFEYYGKPYWAENPLLSVVGSRDIKTVSEQWMRMHLEKFVRDLNVGIISGGANGVDQLSHVIAVKNAVPTVAVLPSGLMQIYPKSLEYLKKQNDKSVCFLTEFEVNQTIHKSHFYFRNRLIAAMGLFTLVVQSSLRSGSLLTVHHALEVGKPIAVVPAHPQMSGFEGNLKLLHDGAFLVREFDDLRDFWVAESTCN